MKVKRLIRQYIYDSKLMQLATVGGDRPWVCSVYFVTDDDLNLYWLSLPTRRHSKYIAENPNAAITIAVKQDIPVIGIQAEGKVSVVNSPEVVAEIMPKYIKKYSQGKEFYERFKIGTNQHVLYKFTPTSYVLFDEQNFSGPDTQQEVILYK